MKWNVKSGRQDAHKSSTETNPVGMEKHQRVNHYIAELHEGLQDAFKEAQVQSTSEAERQKQYYDGKANAVLHEPGDLVLAKADTYKGKGKVKDQ